MDRPARIACISLIAALAIAVPALAFEYPLSDTSIREAFLTGNANNDETTQLFLKYAHSLPAPESGPYVAMISLRTPYEQVAERGATVTNYHVEEAEEEFSGKPMPFLVRVEIDFTSTYPVYPPPGPNGSHSLMQPLPDYGHDFNIDVIQDKKLQPIATHAFLLTSDASYNIWGTSGIVIEQQFDPEKIDSSDLTVRVRTPDGQDIATTFDMSQIN
jgi:hypothetical protein